MDLSFAIALPEDIPAVVAMRNAATGELTARYGEGHWSYEATENGVRNGISEYSRLLVAKEDNRVAGALRLGTRKPWAIDTAYFTKVSRPLYLLDMAVLPSLQRKGIGRYMLGQVKEYAAAWPAEAIRLDAYDHPAGAGAFYQKNGYREVGRVIYRQTPLIYFELLI